MSKAYDIVVYGASGFTGQLVVRHLLSSPTAVKAKFAVAGRSRAKIETGLKAAGAPATTPIIIADSADLASIVAMVQQTKVVLSLVGPYTKYGESLVAACSEHGVHYCDLTGEAPFVADMIAKYTKQALDSRSVLLFACGFDSVPSDLCVFLAVNELKKAAGDRVQVGKVTSAVSMKAYASGGTIDTIWTMLSGSKESKRVGANPYCLSPMGPYNEQIVRRSWGILESAAPSSKVLSYGPDFQYSEWLKCANPISAAITSFVFLTGFAALILLPPVRWLLQKYWLQPGDGPTVAQQEGGWVKMDTVAKSVDKKHEVCIVMRGKGDPGYSGTAKMIAECALALVLDWDRLPPLAKTGGPLTPATALGHVLVERLEATGSFSFKTESDKKD
ncbi:hypothetical protein RQP46_006032 [Phenoliferia psychrophenolica]